MRRHFTRVNTSSPWRFVGARASLWLLMVPLSLGCGSSGSPPERGDRNDTPRRREQRLEAARAARGGSSGAVAGAGTARAGAGGSGAVTGASGGSNGAGRGGNGNGGTSGDNAGAGTGALSATGGDGGGGASGSPGGASGSGNVGGCDPGSTDTTWATACQTEPATTCVAGDWKAAGSNNQGDTLVYESAHFAVYSDGSITAADGQAATDELENVIWPTYFGSPIFFPEPYCNSATKYKASIVVHSDYGLTGGGWGSGYMGMWIGPGATADHWGLAHEFMHAVQAQTKGLDCGSGGNYCGWIYESHANFMPHQLPEYRDDVHCSEMLFNAPHLYLGSTRDRYCNWQFMEYLKDKYCYAASTRSGRRAPPEQRPLHEHRLDARLQHRPAQRLFRRVGAPQTSRGLRGPGAHGERQSRRRRRGVRATYKAITDKSKPERRLRMTALEPLDDAVASESALRIAVPVGAANVGGTTSCGSARTRGRRA